MEEVKTLGFVDFFAKLVFIITLILQFFQLLAKNRELILRGAIFFTHWIEVS